MIKTICTLLALGLDPSSEAARHLLEGLVLEAVQSDDTLPDDREEEGERWDGLS